MYEIPCKSCETVYIGETKNETQTAHKRAVRNGDIDKNEIAEHCWNNDHEIDSNKKKIIVRESFTTARKIKETINSIEKTKHINSISYKLPDIGKPALRKTEQYKKNT